MCHASPVTCHLSPVPCFYRLFLNIYLKSVQEPWYETQKKSFTKTNSEKKFAVPSVFITYALHNLLALI